LLTFDGILLVSSRFKVINLLKFQSIFS